jgi:hypothetical protein
MFLFVFKSIVKGIFDNLICWLHMSKLVLNFAPASGSWFKFASVSQHGCSGTRLAPFDPFNVAYDVWAYDAATGTRTNREPTDSTKLLDFSLCLLVTNTIGGRKSTQEFAN